MYVCTISHAPVFMACYSQQAPWTGGAAKVSARASSASRLIRLRTAVLPSQSQAEWSAVRNSSWPLSAVMRCPVMKQDDVMLSGSVFVRSGRASPAYVIGRRVTSLPGVTSHRPWKRSDMRVYCSACSTRPKAYPMPGVTHCMNAHSCWNALCSPA